MSGAFASSGVPSVRESCTSHSSHCYPAEFVTFVSSGLIPSNSPQHGSPIFYVFFGRYILLCLSLDYRNSRKNRPNESPAVVLVQRSPSNKSLWYFTSWSTWCASSYFLLPTIEHIDVHSFQIPRSNHLLRMEFYSTPFKKFYPIYKKKKRTAKRNRFSLKFTKKGKKCCIMTEKRLRNFCCE